MQRLQKKYEEEIKAKIAKEFAIKNPMALPKLQKIIINAGVGDLMKNKEAMEALKKDLSTITGQHPSVRNAKNSVAGFNIRRGMPVGLTVTLRGERMYAFFDRLVSMVLPRLRDFRGVPQSSFDKSGNYTIGLSEHIVFPEVDVVKSASPHGIEITIVTNSGDPEKSKFLLKILGMAFAKE
ncbi:50S ribosomal protein L5 [Candidatus Woesebacteria bacterium]|nr:50S ribosomal protein L5 [Candidatus Woesebacteria bacterium]